MSTWSRSRHAVARGKLLPVAIGYVSLLSSIRLGSKSSYLYAVRLLMVMPQCGGGSRVRGLLSKVRSNGG